MIDGVKIDCTNLNGVEWLENSLLKFRTDVDTETGELLNGTQTAVYRGLIFTVTQSNKYPNRFYCAFRGSLHKYWNKGKDNANAFTYTDLLQTLADLQNKINIDLSKAVIHNLEFGVNIETPISSTELFKNLVTSGKNNLSMWKVAGKPLGRCVSKHQSTFKIYDKGKQIKDTARNLIRFEMHVNKMVYLKAYNISTLADLQDFPKVYKLGAILLNQWQEIIYYDKTADFRNMSTFQQKKLLYYATPRNWADFNKKQRYRAKKHFAELLQKFGNGNAEHKNIGVQIAEKWQSLSAGFCPPFYHDFKENDSKKMSTFLPLEYTVKTYTKNKEKEKEKFLPKIAENSNGFSNLNATE